MTRRNTRRTIQTEGSVMDANGDGRHLFLVPPTSTVAAAERHCGTHPSSRHQRAMHARTLCTNQLEHAIMMLHHSSRIFHCISLCSRIHQLDMPFIEKAIASFKDSILESETDPPRDEEIVSRLYGSAANDSANPLPRCTCSCYWKCYERIERTIALRRPPRLRGTLARARARHGVPTSVHTPHGMMAFTPGGEVDGQPAHALMQF